MRARIRFDLLSDCLGSLYSNEFTSASVSSSVTPEREMVEVPRASLSRWAITMFV